MCSPCHVPLRAPASGARGPSRRNAWKWATDAGVGRWGGEGLSHRVEPHGALSSGKDGLLPRRHVSQSVNGRANEVAESPVRLARPPSPNPNPGYRHRGPRLPSHLQAAGPPLWPASDVGGAGPQPEPHSGLPARPPQQPGGGGLVPLRAVPARPPDGCPSPTSPHCRAPSLPKWNVRI